MPKYLVRATNRNAYDCVVEAPDNRKKYTVCLEATVAVTAATQVYADSPEDARAQVEADLAEKGWGSVFWTDLSYEAHWAAAHDLRTTDVFTR